MNGWNAGPGDLASDYEPEWGTEPTLEEWMEAEELEQDRREEEEAIRKDKDA